MCLQAPKQWDAVPGLAFQCPVAVQPLHELALPLDGQAVGDFTEPEKQGNGKENQLGTDILENRRQG